jgi:hypothetical protein
MKKKVIKTKAEAIAYAQEWQAWQAEQSLSYMELAHWQEYWNTIGYQFDLLEEFKENGII